MKYGLQVMAQGCHLVDLDEDEIYFQFGRLWQLYGAPLPPGGQPECGILLCEATPCALKLFQANSNLVVFSTKLHFLIKLDKVHDIKYLALREK